MDDGAKAAVASTTATARTKPMLDNSNGLRDSLKAPSACSVVDLDEKMLAEWRSFIIRTDHFEKLFGDIIGAIFKDQLRYMLRQLRAIGRKNAETKRKPYRADIETIVFDKGKAIRFTEEATLELYRRIAKAGGDRAFKLADIAGVFDLNDPEASRHMRAKQQLLARKVNDTTWSSVTERLGAGIDAGESIQQLADGVNEIMLDRFASKHTIARTEVVGCMNGGLHDGHKQAGMTDKTWLTAGDEVVRDPHIALNGTTVGIDEKFVTFNRIGTKAELLYPGDPDGGAEQVINCRCTTVGKKKENKR